jgi:Alpha/beta hydrolase family
VTPNSYVLLHSPLTGPVAWGRLPTLLREHGYHVIVINVQDDDEAPFAERYVTLAAAQISVAESAPPTVFVAHSGAGPLLPAMTANLPDAWRPPGGYVFLDAGIPRMAQPSRLDLLREEDGNLAAELRDSLDAGAHFPTWTVDELADVVPNRDDRIDLVQSLRPRGCDFFTEPLPAFEVWPDAPCGYLRTSAAYDYWTRIAEQRGWSVVHRDLGHFPALANPEATLDALLELTARL